MGDLACDDCGSEIYVTPTESTQFDAEFDCECDDKETVGFVFVEDTARDGEPSTWGLDRNGENYVEFRSGKTPVIRTHTNGRTQRTGYHLAIDDGFGPHFEFRQVPHDAWRADHDPDKWPEETKKDIIDVLNQYGEMKRGEIAEELDLPRKAVIGLMNEMDSDVMHTDKAYYVTKEEFMENWI